MYQQRLLPGEQRDRRRTARVEEASDALNVSRSVRSIRQRFEHPVPAHLASTSAPATPAKKRSPKNASRAQTKTQAQLAAFLKAGIADGPRNSQERSLPTPKQRVPSQKDGALPATVNSLIAKWGGIPPRPRSSDRVPLQERDLQRVDDPALAKKPFVDSVDTFGSSSADFDPSFPKTDPGPSLQSYVAEMNQSRTPTPHLAAVADAVASGDQNLRDLVARGLQHRSTRENEQRRASVDVQEEEVVVVETTEVRQVSVRQSHRPVQSAAGHHASEAAGVEALQAADTGESDWGAGDVYIRELFAEAEDTAERAVQCDENEEYFEAFELYWVVVDLYYKVIPFLTPEEGVDVHERIKMYTRRCEAIREAFEDDPDGQDEIEVRIADATLVSARKEEQIQENFNTGLWNSSAANVEKVELEEPAFSAQDDKEALADSEESPKAIDAVKDAGQSTKTEGTTREGKPRDVPSSGKVQLQKNRFPDYSNSKPLSALPEAPRNPGGVGLSAATKAHRNSLSRPISRSAVRASTSSVSRERVAEMQERVQLMQECLNNFTVKRKHLGPARALELHVTTLNANTFGDLKKLEPLAPELEHKWSSELEVLLSMLQEIKEMRPGVGYGLRDDIARHLPVLERCDRSVRTTMRSFAALSGHVQYVERETGSNSAKGGRGRRRWWVKVPVVRKGGLPEEINRIVKEAEDEMRGVFKVCHEINFEVVKNMPVPPSFFESLPKHARSLIPRELKEGLTTWDMFKVSEYMKDRHIWNKDAANEITSSLEKVALIWEAKTSNKSFLSRTFDIRGERFHQAVTAFRRCQNAIRDLRREWPTMQHTDLDMAKIHHNEDIGFAGLEAYSRALESRAYRLLTRIREVSDANNDAKGIKPNGKNSQSAGRAALVQKSGSLARSNTQPHRNRGRS